MIRSNAAHGIGVRLAVLLVGMFSWENAFCQNNLGTTLTDLWWNANESGWGVTVDHQENTMFLTFFIYRADRTPYWVTAQLTKVGSGPLVNSITFAGDVYETSGPVFTGSFDPLTVTRQKVGTATFSTTDGSSATLQYSVDGSIVTKPITRQTLSNVNYSGRYLGGIVVTSNSCQNPANDNLTTWSVASFSISQSGTSFGMTAKLTNSTGAPGVDNCTFNGTYSQTGSVGAVIGNYYSCTSGAAGTFIFSDLHWTVNGMTGTVNTRDPSCQYNGLISGMTTDHLK